MKRTTYILFCVFIANIIIFTAVCIYVRVNLVEHDGRYRVEFSDEMSEMDLTGVDTLEFVITGMDGSDFYCSNPATIAITSSSLQSGEKMACSRSENLILDKQNGTLKVTVDLSSAADYMKEHPARRTVSLENLRFSVMADKTLKAVRTGDSFKIKLKHVTTEELHLIANTVKVDSCTIGALVVDGNDFNSRALQATDLYLDLDKLHWYQLKDTKVGTVHFTGSGDCRNELSWDQYDKLVWTPKTEKAELHMTLKRGAEVVTSN